MDNNSSIKSIYEEKTSGFMKKAIAGIICAALSKGSIFAGIAMTILYASCFIFIVLMYLALAFSTLPNQQ